ncbi:MAG: hypothetical protein JWM55_1470 [Acidimicrobiaceae bacterium]|nr:hypothetical protein [Acidimicrobiaceae bacterium]
MATKYEAGATVYELAAEFGCHRTTVAERLKKVGVTIRLQPPSEVMINEIVQLYQSGMSSAKVGECLKISPQTVLKYVKDRELGKVIEWKST